MKQRTSLARRPLAGAAISAVGARLTNSPTAAQPKRPDSHHSIEEITVTATPLSRTVE